MGFTVGQRVVLETVRIILDGAAAALNRLYEESDLDPVGCEHMVRAASHVEDAT